MSWWAKMAEVPVAAATTVERAMAVAVGVGVARLVGVRVAAAKMAVVHPEVSTAANWARAAAPKAVRVARVAHTSSGW